MPYVIAWIAAAAGLSVALFLRTRLPKLFRGLGWFLFLLFPFYGLVFSVDAPDLVQFVVRLLPFVLATLVLLWYLLSDVQPIHPAAASPERDSP